MQVLVVDDYVTMIRIIAGQLRLLGFDSIDGADGGGPALQLMRRRSYGLVISDWYMEPMSGLDLLKEVRCDLKLKDTPFIMMSGESNAANIVTAKKAGVSSYIVKPFNADTLRTKLMGILGPL
jgi:two-component system chemotaxis response regulator CheY